jgi:hypothetical protein
MPLLVDILFFQRMIGSKTRFGDRLYETRAPVPIGTNAAKRGVIMGTFHEKNVFIGLSGVMPSETGWKRDTRGFRIQW